MEMKKVKWTAVAVLGVVVLLALVVGLSFLGGGRGYGGWGITLSPALRFGASGGLGHDTCTCAAVRVKCGCGTRDDGAWHDTCACTSLQRKCRCGRLGLHLHL